MRGDGIGELLFKEVCPSELQTLHLLVILFSVGPSVTPSVNSFLG